jgi:hypothetical protein
MRLGQLARKLSIRQSEIVDFLLQRNIQIEDGSNTRLEDSHVVLIMKRYAPAREDEVIAELANEKHAEELMEVVKVEEQPIPELPESNEEKPEVIRVPKIELSGLKVVGKIELPEPKKKEEKPSDSEFTKEPIPEQKQEERPNKTDRKAIQHKKERKQRPHVNPLALQREREAREAAEKRRIQAEREKEKRKQHYHNKVKSVRPGKSSKPAKVESVVTPSEPQPTTWWGKFLKWLRP